MFEAAAAAAAAAGSIPPCGWLDPVSPGRSPITRSESPDAAAGPGPPDRMSPNSSGHLKLETMLTMANSKQREFGLYL